MSSLVCLIFGHLQSTSFSQAQFHLTNTLTGDIERLNPTFEVADYNIASGVDECERCNSDLCMLKVYDLGYTQMDIRDLQFVFKKCHPRASATRTEARQETKPRYRVRLVGLMSLFLPTTSWIWLQFGSLRRRENAAYAIKCA